jgi:hypothetical protein
VDRIIVYPAAVPLETDILSSQKFAMMGLAKLAEVVLGNAPALIGLPCTPGTGLKVSVGAGQVYNVANIDATPYSSLAADTTHNTLKQGILLDPVVLNCPAPGTVGQSINYLVEVAYQEIDTNSVVLPFYNASNPSVPYSGPGGLGAASNTIRSGQCVVQVKAGAAATTGSQTTPAVDSGFIAAYVVTVAYGAASISGGNIAVASGAPFVTMTLPQVVISRFRFPIPLLTAYGTSPAISTAVGDTPVTQFSKAATQSVFWSMPVLDTIDVTKPVKLRIHYTGDVAANNYFIQLGYQIMAAGSVTPGAYTNVTEAISAPATVSNLKNVLTSTAVIPASSLTTQNWVNLVLSRLPLNGSDTNTGNLQILNITMEQ